MDGIYTTINLPDNLGIGASHFYAEVLRVKQVAVELSKGRSIFVVFDELFRGTNVKDAHEASVAIALAYARKRNSHLHHFFPYHRSGRGAEAAGQYRFSLPALRA